MAKRDFLTLGDFERHELDAILAEAARLKDDWRAGRGSEPLRGRTLGLVFHKPSLRTRLSFEVGMRQLGGESLYITDREIGLGSRESIKDVGAVMSRYLDAIMIRTFAHSHVVDLARAASIPVVNGLTDWVHPCQVLSDLLTLREKGRGLDELSIAYVGDGNNVANSWMEAALSYAIDLRIATPPGYEPDRDIAARVEREGRGRVTWTHDPRGAARGAGVIYTDTWTSMGQEAEAGDRRRAFADFQVDDRLVGVAEPNVLVMHCLPAHRGEEATDSVLDGPHSIIYDQAENRLHCQKGILSYCLNGVS